MYSGITLNAFTTVRRTGVGSIVHIQGDDSCQECDGCACSRIFSDWRVATAHSERIRTLYVITSYSKSLMFSICVVAKFNFAFTNDSPLVPPIVSTLSTAPDMPTLQGSSPCLPTVFEDLKVLTMH